jgi:hypothetical protein
VEESKRENGPPVQIKTYNSPTIPVIGIAKWALSSAEAYMKFLVREK